MLFFAYFLIFVSLLVIVFQDFKQRQISWFLIPAAFIGFICKALLHSIPIVHTFLINTAFILIQLVCLTLYFSLKNKKMLNIVDTYLGLGDVLFLIVICTVFSPVNFILFYLLSMIVTLTGVLIYNVVSTKKTNDIPLAGAMAGMLLILLISKPGIDLYNDAYFLNMLHIQ
ncbi:MAG TPA: hypothetical protein VLB84_09255 [Bacteroidia bacterium]|jgi:hypothetical protein|nr:hypothetical protein [Bacteroidia bacterium]